MDELGSIHDQWKEHVQAMEWYTKGAEAGLPFSKFNLAMCLNSGEGVAAPDYPAAADWYRRAADGGVTGAALNLSGMCTVGRGGVRQIIPPHHPCTF
jgi:hypothetical protein